MILIRLTIFLVVLGIGTCLLLYVFTRERKYLSIAWAIFRYTIVFLLAIGALLVLERLILAV